MSQHVNTGNRASTTMLVGEWMLAGVLIAALFGIITMLRRREFDRGPIVDFTPLSPRLKSAPALALTDPVRYRPRLVGAIAPSFGRRLDCRESA